MTGVAGNPTRFYFGAVGGGVWATDNAGRTWDPLFDAEPVASIGALAVAPSNPDVLYVGTGEADMRSDISSGDGVYRSTDGGHSWAHVGLEDTRQIGRILVDPDDPERVLVAALGHAYGPSSERGVYRSTDGGRHWRRVLFRDENTGAIDLARDPGNPRTILASLWNTRRPPWNVYPPFSGPGSGLYRSTDDGDTWRRVDAPGFPSEGLGRIGIAFAPSDSRRVYAIVDAKEGGLYLSRDGGGSWSRQSADARIWERGWYFGGVTVDPKDPETVYVCDTAMYRSKDGGRTFVPIKGAPGGDDYHQLWIDPTAPSRMVLGSDQGAAVSLDGARTWSSWYNQPTAQLYHVAADGQSPYWLFGAQQDSGSVETPSRPDDAQFPGRSWRPISGGGENGYISPDPSDPTVLLGGTVSRFDRRTLQGREIDPTIGHPGAYRRTWTLPLARSPRDPKRLYFSRQTLFETTDGGDSWKVISPDLTRENPGVPPDLGAAAADGPLDSPRRGVIYAIAPSPLEAGLLWCGTDDGLVWRTTDDGSHWVNVTPAGVTAWSKIGVIEASHEDPLSAYLAVDRHRLEDPSPYVYRTRDGGKSWTLIAGGLPAGSHVNVVREDPARRGLLYAGTETGVFVSFDDGERWQPLKLNLPACSVRDIVVAGEDLVIATHGRGFWILDDIARLRQLDPRIALSPVWLYVPAPAVRRHPAPFQGTPAPRDEPAGEAAPTGALIEYHLAATPASPLAVEILDSRGELVRRYSSDEKPSPPDLQKIVVTPDWIAVARPPEVSPGAHRLAWNLQYAVPSGLEATFSSPDDGLWAPPGSYRVRLTAGGVTLTAPLEVVRDPRLRASEADLLSQFKLAREIQAERLRLSASRKTAKGLRDQVAVLRPRATGSAAAELDALSKQLDEIAGALTPPSWEELSGGGPAEPSSLRGLSILFLRLASSVESADAAPTADETAAFGDLRSHLDQALVAWRRLLEDLPRVNARLKEAGLAPLPLD